MPNSSPPRPTPPDTPAPRLTLHANPEDALVRRPPRAKKSRLTRVLPMALLAVAGLVGYAERARLTAWLAASPPASSTPVLPATAPPPIPAPTASASAPVPAAATPARRPEPQPLRDCIKANNLIDDAVVACRFGQVPRDTTPARPVAAPPPPPRQAAQPHARVPAPLQTVRLLIPTWDQKQRIWAEWQWTNDTIHERSVCRNYREGAIAYRECRKAANAYFKNECRRLERAGSAAHPSLKQRYCRAASGYRVLG